MRPAPDHHHEPELPLHTPSVSSVTLAAIIAVIAWISIVAQADLTIDRTLARGLGVLDGVARMSSYLTNLTVLACAVCFTCIALRGRSLAIIRFFRQPTVVTAVVVYMAFVGIAYNLLLRGMWSPRAYRLLLNESLHSVLPMLTVLYWVLFVPRFHLRLRLPAVAHLSRRVPRHHFLAWEFVGLLSLSFHQRRRAWRQTRRRQFRPTVWGISDVDGRIRGDQL